MLRSVLVLLSCFMLASGHTVMSMQSGAYLRMHVIAADDTYAMQAVKYPVRDAVRALYASRADRSRSMLENCRSLLSELTQAAADAAQSAGFAGSVRVSLEERNFPDQVLDGCLIPAGRYPALIIRLGEAQGHNWWGLIDPEMSLRAAMVEEQDAPHEPATPRLDWSLRGFLSALLRIFPDQGGYLCVLGD
ncbi:MAG: stage II sporulation protein R [bacterium]|nr:stage II sporulation protein R [bacterium]